jgi:hypothetical protein
VKPIDGVLEMTNKIDRALTRPISQISSIRNERVDNTTDSKDNKTIIHGYYIKKFMSTNPTS